MTKHNKQRPIPQAKRMQLKENHSWKAPAGFKIVVLDRGAVSFNIPEKWFVAKMEPTFEMHNAAPPDDDARLSVTFFRTAPGIDWSGLPADALLQQSLQGVADRETVGPATSRGPVRRRRSGAIGRIFKNPAAFPAQSRSHDAKNSLLSGGCVWYVACDNQDI